MRRPLGVAVHSQSKGPRGHVHEEFAAFHTQTWSLRGVRTVSKKETRRNGKFRQVQSLNHSRYLRVCFRRHGPE